VHISPVASKCFGREISSASNAVDELEHGALFSEGDGTRTRNHRIDRQSQHKAEEPRIPGFFLLYSIQDQLSTTSERLRENATISGLSARGRGRFRAARTGFPSKIFYSGR
jgi:hypothetical protein